MAAKLDPLILAAADRSFIVGALAKIANKEPSHWLPAPHVASTGGLSLKWAKVAATPPSQIIDAIAVSGPTHCVDGWGFAARALSSLVAGDSHAARHMAYYAQLRAGLSILANLGVGVFNGTNVIIDGAGAVQRVDPGGGYSGLGTHHIAWAALREWANNPTSAAIFLDLVRFRGSSLNDTLTEIWPGFSRVGAAAGLIEAWGLDLKTGLDERRHRNTSSYAPQALNALSSNIPNNLRYLDHIWRLFEPSGTGSFDALDRHLLRSVLWKQQALVEPSAPMTHGSIASQYDNLPAALRSLASKDFLTGVSDPARPELIRLAEAKTTPPASLNMISRALLLLRMATAFTQTSLTEAGVDRASGALRPWLDQLGDARGFWPISAPLPNADDLWEDTRLALEDLDSVRKSPPSRLHDWRSAGWGGLPVLQEAERIAMWSFSR